MAPIPSRPAICRVALPSAWRVTLLGLILAALVGACGGGGTGTVPTKANSLVSTKTYPAVTVTPAYLSVEPRAGVPVQFEGGVCGGGNGQLRAAWNFGDNTPTADSGAHTYARAGSFPFWVQCTDTAGSPVATVRAEIEVLK